MDIGTCTKMWKQTAIFKQNYTLKLFIAFKMACSCWFSFRANLDFSEFLQKKFYNFNNRSTTFTRLPTWLSVPLTRSLLQQTCVSSLKGQILWPCSVLTHSPVDRKGTSMLRLIQMNYIWSIWHIVVFPRNGKCYNILHHNCMPSHMQLVWMSLNTRIKYKLEMFHGPGMAHVKKFPVYCVIFLFIA